MTLLHLSLAVVIWTFVCPFLLAVITAPKVERVFNHVELHKCQLDCWIKSLLKIPWLIYVYGSYVYPCLYTIHIQAPTHAHALGPVVDNGGRVGGAAGEGAGGGHPSRPTRGYGGELQVPHRGLGRRPRSQRFLLCKTLQNYSKDYSTYRTEPSIHFENTTLRHRAFAGHIFNLALLDGPACLSSMKQMHAT